MMETLKWPYCMSKKARHKNSTGYDRTKGSKRDQGIMTPKAPQNMNGKLKVAVGGSTTPSPKGRRTGPSMFDALLGLAAVTTFRKNDKGFQGAGKPKVRRKERSS